MSKASKKHGSAIGKAPQTHSPSRRRSATRKAAAPAQGQRIAAEDRHRMIADAAYYRAQARNFDGGDPVEDWLLAEREIAHQYPSGYDVEREEATGTYRDPGIEG